MSTFSSPNIQFSIMKFLDLMEILRDWFPNLFPDPTVVPAISRNLCITPVTTLTHSTVFFGTSELVENNNNRN